MTSAAVPGPRAHPAPGSAVPGAPPPLQRELTPADGVLVATAAAAPVEDGVGQVIPTVVPNSTGLAHVVAAALCGTAIGLELAAALPRRRRPSR